jgi:hypothetical protein
MSASRAIVAGLVAFGLIILGDAIGVPTWAMFPVLPLAGAWAVVLAP